MTPLRNGVERGPMALGSLLDCSPDDRLEGTGTGNLETRVPDLGEFESSTRSPGRGEIPFRVLRLDMPGRGCAVGRGSIMVVLARLGEIDIPRAGKAALGSGDRGGCTTLRLEVDPVLRTRFTDGMLLTPGSCN